MLGGLDNANDVIDFLPDRPAAPQVRVATAMASRVFKRRASGRR